MSKTMIVGVILAAAIAGFAGAHVGQMWNTGSGWAAGWGPGSWGPGMMRGYAPGAREGDEPAGGWGRGMMGRGGYGPGQGYGGGYGPGYAMGPGMMGGGFGPGMMGQGGWDEAEDLNLTVEQVTRRFERRLALHANNRVKLGSVTEKDGAILVDIVTTDNGGLVHRLAIDRKTGVMRPVGG